MDILDMLEEAMDGAHKRHAFDHELADLMTKFDNTPPQFQDELLGSIVAFAALCFASHSMWHVKDHEGTDCVRDAIQKGTLSFLQMVIGRCKEIAEEEGLTNPFEAPNVNADLVKEMLKEINS